MIYYYYYYKRLIYRVNCISVLVPLFALEDVDDGPRDDPDIVGVFLHRKRLPRTRLPVGHDCRVVAFQNTLEQKPEKNLFV
jgi:hypothetical protein